MHCLKKINKESAQISVKVVTYLIVKLWEHNCRDRVKGPRASGCHQENNRTNCEQCFASILRNNLFEKEINIQMKAKKNSYKK